MQPERRAGGRGWWRGAVKLSAPLTAPQGVPFIVMFLPFILAAFLASEPEGILVCKYDPDRANSQVVLRSDGSIRFVNEEIAEKDAVMKADIFRRRGDRLLYKVVMAGRTDTFDVSLKTLRGTQRLSYGSGEPDKLFHLTCER